MSVRIMVGDCRESLAQLEAKSVQCCVTSPPYFGLRDYGHPGQLGLESTPQEYVEGMVGVFREVRRVLKDDGTLWLNLGDSYNTAGTRHGGARVVGVDIPRAEQIVGTGYKSRIVDLKNKDLIGIPWMVAFAVRSDGWYLRSDIIWAKPNPMPESVTDRPTKSHEYLFLLSKSEKYFYDAPSIAEAATTDEGRPDGIVRDRVFGYDSKQAVLRAARSGNKERKPATERGCPSDGVSGSVPWEGTTRNKRSVWTVGTKPYSGAHFATFPPALIEPCIKAGSAKDDTVLDPFGGAGTTGLVADRLGRNAILCELNPEYAELARKRITSDNPLFVEVA
jgi:DNA modification methylase